MQMTHQDDRERERQAAAAPAGPQGPEQAGTSDTTNTDPPPSAEQIARVLNGGLPGYDEGASALSRKLAREQTTQPGVDALASNRGALWSDLIAAWRTEATQDEAFVKSFGNRDPIATQKFADIDAEQYFEGSLNAAKTGFYAKVAGDIQTSPTARDRIFTLMQNASGPYKFQGQRLPEDQLAAMSRRTHGVGSLYNYALSPAGAAIIDTWARSELALAAGMTPVEAANAGLVPDDKAKLEALKHLLRTTYAGDAKSLADPAASLARAETWYSPAEVSVRAADPDVAFSDMMTVGALQPEWYADGALDLTIEPTGMREARKPTAFDGMMSALWVSRNQPGQTYGVTGGGAREFLERGVTFAQVRSAVPVIPSDTWMAELARLNAAVKSSAPGSSAGEELLRGNDPGVAATAPAYGQVFDSSFEEAHNPSTIGGQAAPVGGEAAVAGGTFDTSRRPTPAHAIAAPAPAPAPVAAVPADPGAAASAAAGSAAGRAPSGTDAPSGGSAAIRGDTSAPPPAPASTAPPSAGARTSPERQTAASPDTSLHGTGTPPAGWQAHEVAAVPSARVMPDDPGHTYHILDTGEVIATSVPTVLSAPAAAAARAAAPAAGPSATATAARAAGAPAASAPTATTPAAPAAPAAAPMASGAAPSAAPAPSAPAPAPAAAAATVAATPAPAGVPPKPVNDVDYKALAGWSAFSANVQAFGLSEAAALRCWKLAMDQLYINQAKYEQLRGDPAAMAAWVDSDPARAGFRTMAEELLALRPLDVSQSYALWSGKPSHEYANAQGHEVLESVTIGKLFDNVSVVFREWNVMKTLWRAISDVYAAELARIMGRKPIHVFQRKSGDIFREVESVRIQEIALRARTRVTYAFHPLTTSGVFGGEAEYERPHSNSYWRTRLQTAAGGDVAKATAAASAIGLRLFDYSGPVSATDLDDRGVVGDVGAATAVINGHNVDVETRCQRAESTLLSAATAAAPAAAPTTGRS